MQIKACYEKIYINQYVCAWGYVCVGKLCVLECGCVCVCVGCVGVCVYRMCVHILYLSSEVGC